MLDKIRGTNIALSEPGQITQSIGATNIPREVVKKACGNLLEKFKVQIIIPGLLLIDSPGHAAFATLRKRGGSVADLAILVIDLIEGFQLQTDESLNLLKQFKVPFVVAATKVDRIPGWHPHHKNSFSDSFAKQREDVKDELENKLYRLVAQLADREFESERFDRITDFTKQVSIVPCSGATGEGVSEVLLMLTGLAQHFLKNKLQLSELAKGSVLEVKDVRGLGTTIDVILYDGRIKIGDYLVIGSRNPVVTKIKALLEPKPLQELRVGRQFEYTNQVTAAAGVKISAVGLDDVIAGSPIVTARSESEIETAKKLVQKEIEEIIYEKSSEGITVRVDTLGSLEAMVKLLQEREIPVKDAETGNVARQDVLEAKNVQDKIKQVILVFNQKVPEEVIAFAKDLGVKIFENNVIYRLLEEYQEWSTKELEKLLREELENVTRPCEIKILHGTIFRQHSPAVFGVEVIRGILKPSVSMKRVDGKTIGKVKEIQKEGQVVVEAKKGDRVAVSMEEPTIGRHIFEGDKLYSVIGENNLKVLRKFYDKLGGDEQELLEFLFK